MRRDGGHKGPAGASVRRRSDQRGLVQGEHGLVRPDGGEPGDIHAGAAGRDEPRVLDLYTRERCRVAAGVGVVIVRIGRAIGIVRSLGRAAVIVMMTAAFVGLRLAVEVIQCEHATAESGDHAEHQQPWKPTAHGPEETLRIPFRKLKAPAGAGGDPAFQRGCRR